MHTDQCAYLPVLLDPVETSAILVVVMKSITKIPAAKTCRIITSSHPLNVVIIYSMLYYNVTEAVEAG